MLWDPRTKRVLALRYPRLLGKVQIWNLQTVGILAALQNQFLNGSFQAAVRVSESNHQWPLTIASGFESETLWVIGGNAEVERIPIAAA
jgi:hypothetical protein